MANNFWKFDYNRAKNSEVTVVEKDGRTFSEL